MTHAKECAVRMPSQRERVVDFPQEAERQHLLDELPKDPLNGVVAMQQQQRE